LGDNLNPKIFIVSRVSESEEIIHFRGRPYGQTLSWTRRVRLG
jgi:hypothetical protein